MCYEKSETRNEKQDKQLHEYIRRCFKNELANFSQQKFEMLYPFVLAGFRPKYKNCKMS